MNLHITSHPAILDELEAAQPELTTITFSSDEDEGDVILPPPQGPSMPRFMTTNNSLGWCPSKWSSIATPINSIVPGYINCTIGYRYSDFLVNDNAIETSAFTRLAMASTGDINQDDNLGKNCIMRKTTYTLFCSNILQFEANFYGHTRSDEAIINAALLDIASLVQNYQVRKFLDGKDKALIGTMLCRFILFFTSPLILSRNIIKNLWGHKKIFGMFCLQDVDSDVDLIRRRLLSIQTMLINYMHIWTNGDVCILPNGMLLYLPAPIRALILLNRSEKAVTYRGECPPDGQEKIDLIMHYANRIEQYADFNYEDVVTEWFQEISTDGTENKNTGTKNGIFDAFGIAF